ncbi:NUDIX hydrolase [Methyloprofundus sp.]|uniref:NUDIX hydrolase n=1 Tax=Methyloprofundus sp. TaxID=2020875 RepID=UPI003D13D287
MVWKPHVTVAAIIEREQRFLLVEEETDNGIAFNQPAGHLESGESLLNAVIREVNEETAWQFTPEYITSIQLWRKNPDFSSFLRVCFVGTCHDHQPEQKLDDGIIATHWLTRDEIIARKTQLRSPLVLTTIDQYLSGEHYPLTLLKTFLDLEP